MRRLLVYLGLLLSITVLPSRAGAQSQLVKLEGQIVCCRDCWARADRTKVVYGIAADLEKAKECVSNGDPTLLAVISAEGETTFYQLEDGRFNRPGKNWLELVGKRVRITGPVRKKKEIQFVKVDALDVLAAAPAETEQRPDVIGAEAELVLRDLFGAEQRLSAFRGRIVVLNFWATYCVPCRKEMPDLSAIQNEYAALGVQVVGASSDTADDRQKVLQFIKETKLNFPVWLGATTGDMAKFGLGPGLPGTAIIGRDGHIVWLSRGIVNASELKTQIDALLAQAATEGKRELASTKARSSEASSVPS
jgi:thiol-disulfide isomerase/thioredoxin